MAAPPPGSKWFKLDDETDILIRTVSEEDFITSAQGLLGSYRKAGPWWVDATKLGWRARVKLDRWGNPQQRRLMDQFQRKYGKRWDARAMESITNEVMARTVFLGFDGIVADDGEPLEDTLENRVRLLNMFPELRDDLFAVAQGVIGAEARLCIERSTGIEADPQAPPIQIVRERMKPAVSLARFQDLDDDDLEE